MIGKRLAFGVLTVAALASSLLAQRPAEAYRGYGGYRSYGGGHRSYSSFSISFGRDRYYDDDYYYRPYRRVYYEPDYGDYYYRPRYRRVHYVSYRPRRSYGYRCRGCGERFGSSFWLSYHYRHTGC